MTARILQFARRNPGAHPVEASGSESGVTALAAPSPPPFLAGASITHDARRDRVEHIVRPVGMGGVFRKPFGCGVWVYHPDGDSMPAQCVTVPETREALNAFLRSRLNHPSNQTTKGNNQ
jgi:hypothetical protein